MHYNCMNSNISSRNLWAFALLLNNEMTTLFLTFKVNWAENDWNWLFSSADSVIAITISTCSTTEGTKFEKLPGNIYCHSTLSILLSVSQ